nr:conserved hypothetical protein [Vibrio chagasii]
MKRSKIWTFEEETCLYLAAEKHAADLRSHMGQMTHESPVIRAIHFHFNKRKVAKGIYETTVERDRCAVIERLAMFNVLTKEMPLIKGKRTFVFKFNPNCKLHEKTPRTAKYAKFWEWLNLDENRSFLAILKTQLEVEINANEDDLAACKAVDERLKAIDIPKSSFSDCFQDSLNRYFIKIDLKYFKDPKGNSRTAPKCLTRDGDYMPDTSFEQRMLSLEVDTGPLNSQRENIAKFYESGFNLNEPSFLACSVGTGIGKSFGALQSYVNVNHQQFSNLSSDDVVETAEELRLVYDGMGISGFTNYVFMTPQKAQIDMHKPNLDLLASRGVHLLSVVSLGDMSSPNYVDWLTGESNFDLYDRVLRVFKGDYPKVYSLLKSIKHDEDLIAQLKKEKSDDNKEAIEIIHRGLIRNHRGFRASLYDLLRDEVNKLRLPLREIVVSGAIADFAYQKKLKDEGRSRKPNFNKVLALFTLAKRLVPFDVCQYVPCVLAMTSQKSLANHCKLVKKKGNNGYGIKRDYSFDALVGGKQQKNDVQVSSVIYMPESEQMRFIENDYLAINEDCPYRVSGVNFMIVVDELHKSYDDHFKSTFTNLIDKETHLNHVLSSAAILVGHADEALSHGITLDSITDDTEDGENIKHLLEFRNRLRTVFEEQSQFSEHIDGLALLSTFRSSGGSFEVDSTEATEVTKITKNVFAFNSKLFTNLEELKSIRVKHKIGVGAKSLYFEKHGAADKNPSLYDVYQLILGLLACGSQIKDEGFLNWIKNGGHHNNGNHHVLYDFLVQVRKVSSEVSSILDQPDLRDGDIRVNTLYAYFQPKVTFSFSPLTEYTGADFKGSEDKIKLTFELNLVNASPEVSYLKMLKGTQNVLLPLSATCGYDRIYDGNYSNRFLKKMCKAVGINFLERSSDSLGDVEAVVADRSKYRDVTFNVVKSDALSFDHGELPPAMADSFNQLKRKVMSYAEGDQLKALPMLRNPYKNIEMMRQFSNMFYCAAKGENGIALSISHDFQKQMSFAISKNIEFMRSNYNLQILFPHPDKYTPKDTIRAFEFEPGTDGRRLRVILYDTQLARGVEACELSSMAELVTIRDDKTNILLVGSFNSAGTGLNNVVSYEFSEKKKDKPDFQEDYQNLFLCGSPYFSSIRGNDGTLDSLNNFALIMKYWGDDKRTSMLLRELPFTLNDGEAYDVLMREHSLAVEKLILQCIGRIERRDTKMTSKIHIPEDVLMASAFVFRDLSKNHRRNKNYRIYRGFSLLGRSYAEFAVSYMEKHSFDNDEIRIHFEEKTERDGTSIDAAHRFELTKEIQNYQRTGNVDSLALNEVMRDPVCFTNPVDWMREVKRCAVSAGAKNIAHTASSMFIPTAMLGEIRLCEKEKGRCFMLTDFSGGVAPYSPWDVIFPSYANDLSSDGDEFTKEFFGYFENLKKQAIDSGYIPSKAIIPLLRGNVGEMMVRRVMDKLGFMPLTNDEVAAKLGTEVYERFDFFYEIDNRLYCIDAKNWSTRRDNQLRSASTTEAAKEKKPKAVLESIDKMGCTSYDKVVFIYANAFYGNTMYTQKHREFNHDSTVAFINLFSKQPKYKETQVLVENKNTGTESPKKFNIIENKIKIYDKFIDLLSGK